MAVVWSTQSAPNGSSGHNRIRIRVAPPITSTSLSGSISAVHLAAHDGIGQSGAHCGVRPCEAPHDAGVEVGIGGHVGDQPGQRRTHHGLVNTALAASIIARISAVMSPGGVSIAVGAAGKAASCTNSALLDHRRYNAVLVVPARSATAAIVRFEYPISTSRSGGRAQYGSVNTWIPGPPGARGLVNDRRV